MSRKPRRAALIKTENLQQRVSRHARRWCLLGLTALLVATTLIPGESHARMGTGSVLIMAWMILLAAWCCGRSLVWHGGVRWDWPTGLLAIVAGLHAVSAYLMGSQGNQRAAINAAWLWISYAVAFFMIRQLLDWALLQRAIIAVMLGLAAGLSAYGFYQYGYSLPASQAQYYANPEAELARAGVVAPEGSVQRQLFEIRLNTRQPFATFALQNSLAGFLAPWLVVACGIGIGGTPWYWRAATWRVKLGLVCCVVLLAGCLALTGSRTGCIAAIAGIVLLGLEKFTRKQRRSRLVIIGVMAAAAIAVPLLAWSGAVQTEAVRQAVRSLTFRFQYWQATASLVGDYPWWGCGPGNFQEYYTRYKLPVASETIADPHNFLIEVAATAGLPAAIILTVFLGALVWRGSRPTRSTDPGHEAGANQSVRPPGDGERGYIYAGGCAGVLLAYLAGIVLDSAPEVVVALLCLPVAGVITILLDDWVVAGSTCARWLLVAALAFWVNLLAAGGIGYASVAVSGWLLMALAMNRRDNAMKLSSTAMAPSTKSTDDTTTGKLRDRFTRHGLADRALLPLALVLMLACYVTAYAPVVRASQRLFDGQYFQRTGQTARAIEAYQAAAESDARWPEPWMHQASLRFQIWRHDPTSMTWALFADSLQHALRRNPQSSVAFRQAGLWYLIAHDASGSTASESHRTAAERLPIAVQYVDQACRLHPHAAMRHAELAWVLWLAGEKPRAIQEADEALRLDALMPDELQKLAAQSLFDGQLGQLPEVPADVNNAEQLMHWLRKTATSQSPDE